jgi:hypothetical protein
MLWKIAHTLRSWFGIGPSFILAEPGTNPLDEPELYIRRRQSRMGMLLLAGVLTVILVAVIVFTVRAYVSPA